MSPNATPMRKPLTIFSPDEPPPMSSSTRSRKSMSPGRVSRLADIAAGEAPVVTVVGVVVLLPARVVVLTVEACIVRPSAGLPRLQMTDALRRDEASETAIYTATAPRPYKPTPYLAAQDALVATRSGSRMRQSHAAVSRQGRAVPPCTGIKQSARRVQSSRAIRSGGSSGVNGDGCSGCNARRRMRRMSTPSEPTPPVSPGLWIPEAAKSPSAELFSRLRPPRALPLSGGEELPAT